MFFTRAEVPKIKLHMTECLIILELFLALSKSSVSKKNVMKLFSNKLTGSEISE